MIYLTFVLGVDIIYICLHLCNVPILGQVIVKVQNIFICTQNSICIVSYQCLELHVYTFNESFI